MRRASFVVALLAGCLPPPQYRCDENVDCGPGGRCESIGYCSFADPGCPGTMQRFADGAGPLSGSCVADDAGVDDAGTVDSPTTCPAGYMQIANGPPGHRYRLTSGAASWTAQVTDCGGDGASTYLGLPNNLIELGAMMQLNGSNKIWLGIEDRTNEGVFVDVQGVSPTFLPWKPGSPDQNSNNNKDCVAADSPTEIIDDACDADYKAVCECED